MEKIKTEMTKSARHESMEVYVILKSQGKNTGQCYLWHHEKYQTGVQKEWKAVLGSVRMIKCQKNTQSS